jgi:hypothetical protein
MNPIDPLKDLLTALWPSLPAIAFFASLIVGCLVTRNYAAPRLRHRRLQGRLADLQDHREGKHLLRTTAVLAPKPRLVVSEDGRVAAHIGACVERAEKLVRSLDGQVSDEILAEAKRLHRHLVGVHAEVSR